VGWAAATTRVLPTLPELAEVMAPLGAAILEQARRRGAAVGLSPGASQT
jgi:hypothetical protein